MPQMKSVEELLDALREEVREEVWEEIKSGMENGKFFHINKDNFTVGPFWDPDSSWSYSFEEIAKGQKTYISDGVSKKTILKALRTLIKLINSP